MPGIALVFLKPALPLPRLVVYKPRHGFLPSGQNLRSTEGCAPNKVRHHLVGEASERGLHTLSLECSKVRQDHEVVQAGSFKLVDAAAHLRRFASSLLRTYLLRASADSARALPGLGDT